MTKELPRSGVPGVTWSTHAEAWLVRVSINGNRQHVGVFRDLAAAIAARNEAELKARVKRAPRQYPAREAACAALTAAGRPLTVEELAATLGKERNYVHALVQKMKAAGRIHVAGWTRTANSGPWTARWTIGMRIDAERPSPQSSATKSAKSRFITKVAAQATSPLTLALANFS